MKNLPRKNLPYIEELGAVYSPNGVAIAPDKRYELVIEYLKLSPSFEAVTKKLANKKISHSLPSDFDLVRQIVLDFGPLYTMRESDWWTKYGRFLYGIKAPLPLVNLRGTLNKDNKELVCNWSGLDSVVVELPLSLTLPQALTQLRKQLSNYDFSNEIPKEVASKYQLSTSKLRIETLFNGIQALKMYKRNEPLWAIGNQLRLIPAQSFLLEDMNDMDAIELSDRKEILSIATSRLIKTAALIAENAARGRFPDDQKFNEAIVIPYQRKAGRPMGSIKKKKSSSVN